ncbi:hypothetical protein C8N31_112105 [Sulfitobacter mediterraneus]|uniref:Uncharacterized protein n=1 Tax=Sulfitobacter mediterraneus TaxID=83219 RepID=A0A2T6CAQ1_9RHOB|nr:hypothetical protein C8N31_112105 [Sulfitobacter mediterraneus]
MVRSVRPFCYWLPQRQLLGCRLNRDRGVSVPEDAQTRIEGWENTTTGSGQRAQFGHKPPAPDIGAKIEIIPMTRPQSYCAVKSPMVS